MKKRMVQILLPTIAIVSLNTSVAPVYGAEFTKQIDVATQEEPTETQEIQLSAGISKELDDIMIGNIQCCITENEPSLSKQESSLSKQQEQYDGWAITNVNIRKSPSVESEVIDVIGFNTKIAYSYYNNDWAVIDYLLEDKEITAYISTKYITDTECPYIEYSVPQNKGFKSYMSYKAIKDKSSRQYNLQKNYAYTGNYGIRQVNGRYCVAIGTAFDAQVGTYFDLILDNGVIIECIVGDIKADIHTESNNIATEHNGCVSEFIVDTSKLPHKVYNSNNGSGDISDCCDEWNSPVTGIKIYYKNILN